MSVSRRPLISYGGENLQEQALRRIVEVGEPYVAEDRSEASTLANLYKRGWLNRERVGGRWCYSIRPADPPEMEQQELIV